MPTQIRELKPENDRLCDEIDDLRDALENAEVTLKNTI
jgi:hypothetical protein